MLRTLFITMALPALTAAHAADEYTVSGQDVTVASESITDKPSVLIYGTDSTTLNGTSISNAGAVIIGQQDADTAGTGVTSLKDSLISSGGDVLVGGTDISIAGGTDVESTGGDVAIQTVNLTVGTAGVTVPEDSVVAHNITLNVSGSSLIQGAAVLLAENGQLSIQGGSTSTNTITGKHTLVGASGELSVTGAMNYITAGAQVEGGTQASIIAEVINTVDAGQIKSVSGSLIIHAQSNLINAGSLLQAKTGVSIMATNLTGANGNLIEDTRIETETGGINVGGLINWVEEGAQLLAKSGDIQIAGYYANLVTGVTEEGTRTVYLTAQNGDVKISGGMIAENLVEAAVLTAAGSESTIDIEGKASGIFCGSQLNASSGITIIAHGQAADDGNFIDSSTLQASAGEVNITAANFNQVDASSITAASGLSVVSNGGDSNDGNAVYFSTLQTTTDDVKVIAQGINYVQDSDFVADAGMVKFEGASNLVWNGTNVTAQTGIVLDSNGLASGHGNAVDGANLNTVEGDIKLLSSLSNVVSGGAQLLAQSGNVSLVTDSPDVYANVIIGENTAITAQDGFLLIDGMESGENQVESAILKADGTNGIIAISGKSNSIGEGAQLLAAQGVNISSSGVEPDDGNVVYASLIQADNGNVEIAANGLNYLIEADITASEGMVKLDGALNCLLDGSVLEGATGVSVVADGASPGYGNLVDASDILAKDGDVLIAALLSSQISSGANVHAESGNVTIAGSVANIVTGADTCITAGDGALNMLGGLTAENHVEDATVQAFGAEGAINMSGVANGIYNGALLQADAGVSFISYGLADDDGNLVDASSVHALAGDVTLQAEGINMVREGQLVADEGKLSMTGESNIIREASTVQVAQGVTLTTSATNAKDSNTVSGSSVTTSSNDIILLSDVYNVVGNSTMSAEQGCIKLQSVSDTPALSKNIVVAEDDHTTALTAAQNIVIHGINHIISEDIGAVSIVSLQGDIEITGNNSITNVSLLAQGKGGDISIKTGKGDMTTVIEDTVISGETVTIVGATGDRTDENLAVVTGNVTSITSRGEDAGITLNNVFVKDTQQYASNIRAEEGGDIVIVNRVDVQNGALSLNPAASGEEGRIVVDAGNVLNVRAESVLAGRLSGTGDINKSCGDALLLDADHSEFVGSIYVNGALGGAAGSGIDGGNAGSWLEISGAGVGMDASLVLKNTDLVLTTAETCIGTLDTTQDAESNDQDTAFTLLSDGSYTNDGNVRADFTTVGSVLEVNKGSVGDVVNAKDMKLSDATLIKLDASVNGAEVVADTINATGTINAAASTGVNTTSTSTAPGTARVYINHVDSAAAADASEGARTTIMTGNMASAINEDVLYDMAKRENGTYQRVLQERNMHLENNADHVDLVYSKNYLSVDKTPRMQMVADAVKAVSDTLDHSDGTLAASDNRLHHLVDAFDYTRSEVAAKRALDSIAGTGNTLPRLMQFDSSRHHLNNLRSHLNMPQCADKGGANRNSHVWMSYTGAYDSLDGDSYMGDYSRTSHGALMGVDCSINCKLRMGLSLGYESAIGRADSTRVDADTFFTDVYATGVIGRYKHRASVGLAAGRYETKRGVLVEAGYHTFAGQGMGESDGLTLNMGYEISTDYQLDTCSSVSPFAAFNLAWHRLDTLTEGGLGEVGLVSSYDNEWQADVALGLSFRREFAALRNQSAALFYANAAMRLELADDRAMSLNRFSGGTSGWSTSGVERSPFHFEVGAGVEVPLSPSWTGSAGGSIDFGPDRSSFSINFGVRYDF